MKEIFDRDGSTIAAESLAQIAALYHIEAEIRGRPSAERLAVRETRSAQLVEAFGQWLRAQRARVSRKSRNGEKLTYIASHWGGLLVFRNRPAASRSIPTPSKTPAGRWPSPEKMNYSPVTTRAAEAGVASPR